MRKTYILPALTASGVLLSVIGFLSSPIIATYLGLLFGLGALLLSVSIFVPSVAVLTFYLALDPVLKISRKAKDDKHHY